MATKKDENKKSESQAAKPQMQYRTLGNTGLKVSVISLGTYFGPQVTDPKTNAAGWKVGFDAGVNFFDCAEGYAEGASEELFGKYVREMGWKRSDLVVSTKIFWGGKGVNDVGCSRKHLMEGTNASLKRLQMDYVDLLFCHRPDPQTPIEEIVRTMNIIINQGKAFYWGTSEWRAADIAEAVAIAKENHLIGPVVEQPEYNMFKRERVEKEYQPLYKSIKLGNTIWSPLGSGMLTGRYNPKKGQGKDPTVQGVPKIPSWAARFSNPEEANKIYATLDKLADIAEELGGNLAHLGLAWCIKNPNVSTAITAASKPEQIEDSLKALNMLPKLTDDVMERIEKILGNKPGPEPFFGR